MIRKYAQDTGYVTITSDLRSVQPTHPVGVRQQRYAKISFRGEAVLDDEN